jgi:two-component system sensor histidine kinase UhpB
MSLQRRLTTSIGLGLLASLVFGGLFVLWDAARQVETEMQSAIGVAERITRVTIGDSGGGPDRDQRLEHLIREFDHNRHLRATLLDRHNHAVLASKPLSPDTRVPEWLHRLLDGGAETARINLSPEFQNYQAIVLETDSANELAEKWGAIGLSLGVLIAFATVVLGLVYWISARGLRPLQALTLAFDRVGLGDYSPRVAESGATELALLAHEFNKMVARLSTMHLQNARLNQLLATVQEQDRAEFARELHDEVGPFLFSVGLDISAIQTISRNGDVADQLAPRLEAIRASVVHMQKHLKLILGRLRPAVLLDLGLAQAMDNLIDFWRERHPDVVFDLKMARESFGERLDECIYSIVRESLNNALRHGMPSEIDIKIQTVVEDKSVMVEVVDDGGGMNPSNAAIGFGITGMQERAAMLGGTILVRNRGDGKGVAVNAQLPRPSSSESS